MSPPASSGSSHGAGNLRMIIRIVPLFIISAVVTVFLYSDLIMRELKTDKFSFSDLYQLDKDSTFHIISTLGAKDIMPPMKTDEMRVGSNVNHSSTSSDSMPESSSEHKHAQSLGKDEKQFNGEKSPKPAEASPNESRTTTQPSAIKISIEDIQNLRKRAYDALVWSASEGNKKSRVIDWAKVSVGDIHILSKLIGYLDFLVSEYGSTQNGSDSQSIEEFVRRGLTCSDRVAEEQESILKVVMPDICSEVEWYKLAQLGMPEARVFIDIGANKGYLASLFLALWGGGGVGISPVGVFSAAKKTGIWDGSRNPAGYCKDGMNYGLQLHCPETYVRNDYGACTYRPEGKMRVYSIDGSSVLTETMNRLIEGEILPSARRVYAKVNQYKTGVSPSPPEAAAAAVDAIDFSDLWSYYNFAVSDRQGIAKFTKQGKGTHSGPGFEGGKIRTPDMLEGVEVEEVTMTTVERFIAEKGIPHIDVLKVDAEGNDNKVLDGAMGIISNQTLLFTFEGGGGVKMTKEMVQKYDSLGYSCFSTSRAGLFKWNSECMKYIEKRGSQKDKGNIFCASRIRAPLLALTLEALSFPAMLQQVRLKKLKVATSGPLLDTPQKQMSFDAVSVDDLSDAYVRWKPFCSEWPGCAAKL